MQATNLTPVTNNPQTASYLAIKPIMEVLKSSVNKNPSNTLPTDTLGTIQQNTHLVAPSTIYTEHGKILQQKIPGTLIGMA